MKFSERNTIKDLLKITAMKITKITSVFICLMLSILLLGSARFTDDPKRSGNQDNPLAVISSKQMDANSISTWYRNNGSFNRHPLTGNAGFECPKGSQKFARYASGLWIAAIVGNDTLLAIAEYNYEYLPGYIDNNGIAQGKDDSLYRIYNFYKKDLSAYDYLHWPLDQGAYFDSTGKPFVMGDQTMFYSHTDGYPEAHNNNAGSTAPLKAQILQTNWSYVKNTGPLNSVVFTEHRIINRSNLPWNRCYFAIWTDDDLGDGNDDAVGCDTVLNLGYTFNQDNFDPSYGSAPPAVAFKILRGPLVPSANDTARYYSPPGSNNLRVKPGYKISGMSAFTMFNGGDPSLGDPIDYREAYRNFQGIKRNGQVWINPINGQVTSFAYSGDPSTGTGWYETNAGDRRFLQSMGPLTVNPGDTQSIITAQIIARGFTNLSSVASLKTSAKFVQNYFDSNYDAGISLVQPTVNSFTPGNGSIFLSWNDTCERITYPNNFSGGTYRFQGYNVYRIRPNNVSPSKSDTILLKTFDIVDGVTDIRDSIYLEEFQSITYGIVQYGSDNGIARSIELHKDTVSGSEFKNGSEYKFAVAAYYYDPTGGLFTLPKVLVSSISRNIIKVVAQGLAPETQIEYQFGDTLLTDQGDLGVIPVLNDPLKLVYAAYVTTISQSSGVFKWTLQKIMNGDTVNVLSDPQNFSAVPDSSFTFDGMILYQQVIRDSGIVRDNSLLNGVKYAGGRGYEYMPPGNIWFEGPDTNAVKTAKVITNRQFENRSIGLSFPNSMTFKGLPSKIIANQNSLVPIAGQNSILRGGPLRKISIVFGQMSKSYRYVPKDTSITSTPYADYVNVPFSVFAVDELDSSGGVPRQLNTAFVDYDNDGTWDPDTSVLGNYHFTLIFASTYNASAQGDYISKNALSASFVNGFRALDVMYAWLPRAKKNADGTPKTYTAGDRLTVWPYRITRPEFVPGYPVKYTWEVQGTTVSSSAITPAEIASINVFPNPYYGTSELEYDSGGEKFIYFSNLPLQSKIYIYTLDGILVKRIDRDNSDPNSSLQKWDLKNSDGSFAASGMYIVFVDCGSAGAKTLKIAVFKSN